MEKISMKRIIACLGVLILLVALASIAIVPLAQAHAEPESCTPPIDGTVETAPDQLVCIATQALDPDKSKLEVFDASGTQVDKGDSTVDLNDPDRMTISVSLDTAKMSDGVYTAKWETFSVDDNEDANGKFTFTVGSPSAAQPTAAATSSAEPTTAPEPSATAAAPEPTGPAAPSTPAPTTTLPITGAAMSNLGFVFIALLGLMLVGFGLMVHARR